MYRSFIIINTLLTITGGFQQSGTGESTNPSGLCVDPTPHVSIEANPENPWFRNENGVFYHLAFHNLEVSDGGPDVMTMVFTMPGAEDYLDGAGILNDELGVRTEEKVEIVGNTITIRSTRRPLVRVYGQGNQTIGAWLYLKPSNVIPFQGLTIALESMRVVDDGCFVGWSGGFRTAVTF